MNAALTRLHAEIRRQIYTLPPGTCPACGNSGYVMVGLKRTACEWCASPVRLPLKYFIRLQCAHCGQEFLRLGRRHRQKSRQNPGYRRYCSILCQHAGLRGRKRDAPTTS